jgi:hypothetical protein
MYISARCRRPISYTCNGRVLCHDYRATGGAEHCSCTTAVTVLSTSRSGVLCYDYRATDRVKLGCFTAVATVHFTGRSRALCYNYRATGGVEHHFSTAAATRVVPSPSTATTAADVHCTQYSLEQFLRQPPLPTPAKLKLLQTSNNPRKKINAASPVLREAITKYFKRARPRTAEEDADGPCAYTPLVPPSSPSQSAVTRDQQQVDMILNRYYAEIFSNSPSNVERCDILQGP